MCENLLIIKIILWALLAVLLIVILALFIPVAVEIRYNDDVFVTVKYLFLHFLVVGGDNKEKPKKKEKKPSRKKKQPAKKKDTAASKKTVVSENPKNSKGNTVKKTKEKKSKKKKKEPKDDNIIVKWIKNTFKKKGLEGLLNAFKEIARLAGNLLKPIFKHIRIKKLDLNVTVAFEDAADTAVKYGYFCSGIYPALAVLLRVMKYDDYNVNIVPDFDKKSPEFDVLVELKLLPWFVVAGAVKTLINFLILRSKGKL